MASDADQTHYESYGLIVSHFLFVPSTTVSYRPTLSVGTRHGLAGLKYKMSFNESSAQMVISIDLSPRLS